MGSQRRLVFKNDDVFFYINHLGPAASNGADSTNLVTIDGDTADTGGFRLRLGADEFAFFPVYGAEGIKVTAATADVMIEFAYWKITR